MLKWAEAQGADGDALARQAGIDRRSFADPDARISIDKIWNLWHALIELYPDAAIGLLRRAPTAWDETRHVDGFPGSHSVIARRDGDAWYVAGIAGPDAVELEFDPWWLSAERSGMLVKDGADGAAGPQGPPGSGGGGLSQTIVTLSGAATSIPIPAGCLWFAYAGRITSSVSNSYIRGHLYGETDSLQRLGTGSLTIISSEVWEHPQDSTSTFAASTGEGSLRSISGTMYGPRNAAVRTQSHSRGSWLEGAAHQNFLDTTADVAADDDTMRIVADVGTLAGDIAFTWFF